MNHPARLYRIKAMLLEYRVVSRQRFLDELEISLATFKRDLAYLRDQMNAPIAYDAEAGGYRLDTESYGPRHELPGMWFNADEIHALLTVQQLLQELQPGLLTPHVQPLLDRLYPLLDSPESARSEVQKRIRILRINGRHVGTKSFGPVSTAVLRRRRLTIQHFHRGRNTLETRILSPQRLIYYRDNWYVDAWCHLREALRSFALDTIQDVELLDEPAFEVTDTELDAAFTAGYGIFAGAEVEWAVLRFSAERARWVSKELWHPQQQSNLEPDGHYVLRVPYSDDRELVMDILRHVPEVSVLGPATLRTRVKKLLEEGIEALNVRSKK